MTVAMLAAGSAGVFICLLLGMSGAAAAWLGASIVFAPLAAAAWDYTASVGACADSAAPTLARRLPQAFALGAVVPFRSSSRTTEAGHGIASSTTNRTDRFFSRDCPSA